MGLLNRQNKKFDYQPRYYKGEGSPFELKHRFDEHRTSVGKKKSLKGKFSSAINEFNTSEHGGFNKTIIAIVLILTLIFLYLIDFDLSIFLPNN